jgi:hypothetical protein
MTPDTWAGTTRAEFQALMLVYETEGPPYLRYPPEPLAWSRDARSAIDELSRYAFADDAPATDVVRQLLTLFVELGDHARLLLESAGQDEETRSMAINAARRRQIRGLTERAIRRAVSEVRHRSGRAPTRTAVAALIGTSESTLRRAMNEFGMGRWPPAPLDE